MLLRLAAGRYPIHLESALHAAPELELEVADTPGLQVVDVWFEAR